MSKLAFSTATGMLSRLIVVTSLAVAANAQPASTPVGSIGGTLTDSETGKPLSGKTVTTTVASKPVTVQSDSAGHYQLAGLPPGSYSIVVDPGPSASRKTITLAPGATLTSIDFAVDVPGLITGRVLDANKEPVPNAWVFLIQKSYRNGRVSYGQRSVTVTDDQGRYTFARFLAPLQPFLVLAKPRTLNIPAISEAADDPKLRKPVFAPTLYPNSSSFEGAQTLVLHSGERREAVDIQVTRAPSYCVQGTTETAGAPAAMSFQIHEDQPSNGPTGLASSAFITPPNGKTGPDGKFRICELHPGSYDISVSEWSAKGIGSFGAMQVLIVDRDVANVKLGTLPGIPLAGEVVLDSETPPQKVTADMSVALEPVNRAPFATEMQALGAKASLPGTFTFAPLLVDEYSVNVRGLPAGFYVKDITYGTASVLVDTLRLGTAVGDSGMKILVAQDGGSLTVKVTDKDGNPVQSCGVWLLPTTANSAVSLEAMLFTGSTDAAGVFTSGTLRPGKYLVVASNAHLDHSAGSIDRLFAARGHATEVGVAPRATAQVTVRPVKVD